MNDLAAPSWPPLDPLQRETRCAPESSLERLDLGRRGARCPFLTNLSDRDAMPGRDASWPALRRVLDFLPQLLLVCDGGGETLHVNRSARQWFLARPGWDDLEGAVRLACERLSACDRASSDPGDHSARVSSYATDGWYWIEAVAIGEVCVPPVLPAVLVVIEPPEEPSHVDVAMRSRYHLTHSETRVAKLLAQGKSNRQIATELHVSVHTIRHHVEHVFAKLGIHTRTATRALLAERGR